MTRAPANVEDPASSPEATERLPDEIDAETLRKYFTLAKADQEAVEKCRGAVNKVGFAIQLCTLRWQGHFLPDLQNLPSAEKLRGRGRSASARIRPIGEPVRHDLLGRRSR